MPALPRFRGWHVSCLLSIYYSCLGSNGSQIESFFHCQSSRCSFSRGLRRAGGCMSARFSLISRECVTRPRGSHEIIVMLAALVAFGSAIPANPYLSSTLISHVTFQNMAESSSSSNPPERASTWTCDENDLDVRRMVITPGMIEQKADVHTDRFESVAPTVNFPPITVSAMA